MSNASEKKPDGGVVEGVALASNSKGNEGNGFYSPYAKTSYQAYETKPTKDSARAYAAKSMMKGGR